MSTKKKYTSEDLHREFGDLTFAKVLSSFRLSEGASQKDFAKKLALSPANLCDLEKARKLPSPLRAAKIAKQLGLPEAFLIQVALQDVLRASKLHYTVRLAA
jgi:transcriptional regulator with XRE-family HTH domain